MAVGSERRADGEPLVEAAACAVHEQNRRSGAGFCVLDRSALRRDELARAGEAGAYCGEVAPVEPVTHRSARSGEREHAETELVLRAVHAIHATPRAHRATFVELLTCDADAAYSTVVN